MTTPDVQVMATEYTVSALPEYHPDRDLSEITVSYRGNGRWAVARHRWCLDTNGEWDFESMPSERTDEWLAAHRFDLETALTLARREAPKVRVGGRTAAEALATRGGETRG